MAQLHFQNCHYFIDTLLIKIVSMHLINLKLTLSLLLLCSFVHSQVSTHQEYMDSLVKNIQNTPVDSTRVFLLDKIGYDYSSLNADKGLEYARQANKLAKELGLKKQEASSLAVIAVNYSAKSEFEKAIEYNKRSIKIYNSIGDSLAVAAVNSNQSQIYLKIGNYVKALDCNFSALKVYSQHNLHRNKGIVLENIGNIYYELKEYYKSSKNYREALAIYKKHASKTDVARCLGNMSRVYMDKGYYQEALNHLNEAVEINELNNNQASKLINLTNIGNVHFRQTNYQKALLYFNESLKLSDSLGMKDYSAINKGNIGESYLRLFEASNNKNKSLLDVAITDLKDAIFLCESIGLTAPKIEFTEYLIEAYTYQKEYKAALDLLAKKVQWKDSLYTIESKKELAKIELNREKELKNKDIVIKNKALEIAKLNSQKNTLFYSLVILILSLIFFLAYRSFRKRERQNTQLIADLRQVQSHEIRGPIATILGLSSLLKDRSRSEDSKIKIINGIEEIATELDKTVVEIIKNSND